AAHPELVGTLRNLRQDHSMIAHLLGGLTAASARHPARPRALGGAEPTGRTRGGHAGPPYGYGIGHFPALPGALVALC
ncbi:hypothetical protein ACFWD6_11320, partial [Streptomyces diastaticus]